jgi:hypothetical protein
VVSGVCWVKANKGKMKNNINGKDLID